MQDLRGWKPVTPCVLLWECAAPKAHASIRVLTEPLSELPMELQMGLEKKYFHSLCGSEQPAKCKVFCLFLSQPFFFPKHFVTLASNKITSDFKMFHEERKPFVFKAVCHLATTYSLLRAFDLYCDSLKHSMENK